MGGRFDFLEMGDPKALKDNGGRTFDVADYLRDALASAENGNFEYALKVYTRALGLDAENSVAWLGQVHCLLELDEPKEARLWANKGIEKWPRSAELLGCRAVALARMGLSAEAVEASDASMAYKGDGPWVWLARGYVLLWKGEGSAAYCFKKGLESRGQDRWLQLQASGLCVSAGDPALGLAYARSAVELGQPTPLVFYRLAQCYLGLGWNEQAREEARKGRLLQGELNTAFVDLERLSNKHGLKGFFHRIFGS